MAPPSQGLEPPANPERFNVLNDSALLYGKVGIVGTQVDTLYEFDGNTVDEREFLTGVRFGGGLELALTEKTKLRLDYTRTDYESHKTDYVVGEDSFDSAENLFRIGFTRSF